MQKEGEKIPPLLCFHFFPPSLLPPSHICTLPVKFLITRHLSSSRGRNCRRDSTGCTLAAVISLKMFDSHPDVISATFMLHSCGGGGGGRDKTRFLQNSQCQRNQRHPMCEDNKRQALCTGESNPVIISAAVLAALQIQSSPFFTLMKNTRCSGTFHAQCGVRKTAKNSRSVESD